MRNFSIVSHAKFVSYQINAGEYSKTVLEREVLVALAKAFESRLTSVLSDYESILNGSDTQLLCPSENRVLVDLAQFAQLVRNCEYDYWDPMSRGTSLFQYINLSTGATVTWVHSVI